MSSSISKVRNIALACFVRWNLPSLVTTGRLQPIAWRVVFAPEKPIGSYKRSALYINPE